MSLILNVVTHPYLWGVIMLSSLGYQWYNSAQKEKNHQKGIEREVLTAFDVNRDGIISREEVRQQYPFLSMQYGTEEITRVFYLNKNKFENWRE